MEMYFEMGIVQISGDPVYWETDIRYEPMESAMSIFTVLATIYFANNLASMTRKINYGRSGHGSTVLKIV